MQVSIISALLCISYLLTKHTIADFVLQTAYQYKNKGIYGHPGGLLHAAIHILLSVPIILVFPTASVARMGEILAMEFVIHYHVDFLKVRINEKMRLNHESRYYWWGLGLDQLAHGLTYVIMTGLLFAKEL